jgi:hypothetical protein
LASELSMEKPSQTTVSTSVTYKGPSVAGFILTLMIAAGLYFGMTYLPKMNLDFLSYSVVAENAPHSLFYKMVWFVQDFTNAQFYASFFAGIGMLLGAVIAYYLSMKRSSKSGFTISYTVGVLAGSMEKSVGLALPPLHIAPLYLAAGFIVVILSYQLSKLLCRKKVNRVSMSEALKTGLE